LQMANTVLMTFFFFLKKILTYFPVFSPFAWILSLFLQLITWEFINNKM
jgi:hypothetical protein